MRSKEIMDAVEQGSSFVVTRGGRPMGQLIPLRRRFVPRAQFVASSQSAAEPSLADFRATQEANLSTSFEDPYDR